MKAAFFLGVFSLRVISLVCIPSARSMSGQGRTQSINSHPLFLFYHHWKRKTPVKVIPVSIFFWLGVLILWCWTFLLPARTRMHKFHLRDSIEVFKWLNCTVKWYILYNFEFTSVDSGYGLDFIFLFSHFVLCVFCPWSYFGHVG